MQTLLDRWLLLLERAVADPTAPITSLPVMTPAENDRVAEYEGRSGPRPEGSVLDMFRAALRDGPHVTALVDGDGGWTRRELWDRSSAVVRLCSSSAASRPMTSWCSRSTGPSTSWPPCSPAGASEACPCPSGRCSRRPGARPWPQPARRRSSSTRTPSAGTRSRRRDQRARPPDRPRRATAYVLHTSGSTGAPKGVMVTHPALLASTVARVDAYGNPPDTALLAHDLAFDAGMGIIAWYLALTGGRLVMTTHDERLDPDLLVSSSRPTAWASSTSCRPTTGCSSTAPTPPRSDPSGGDPRRRASAPARSWPPPRGAARHEARERVRADPLHRVGGGPRAHGQDADVARLPIGRPIRGVVARVADAAGLPVPPESEGELLLCGHLLADGYLGLRPRDRRALRPPGRPSLVPHGRPRPVGPGRRRSFVGRVMPSSSSAATASSPRRSPQSSSLSRR